MLLLLNYNSITYLFEAIFRSDGIDRIRGCGEGLGVDRRGRRR